MTPWSRATHAQRGKALDDARVQVRDLIDALNLSDPVETAVVLGIDHLIGLVTETLSYRLGDKPRRDFSAVNDVTLNALAKLKEATMPVVQKQVDQKLTELGIDQRRTIYAADFGCHLFLRAQGLDSRYSGVAHHVTVPFGDYDRALQLKDEWLENRTDPVADGRKALRLWGQKETADA